MTWANFITAWQFFLIFCTSQKYFYTPLNSTLFAYGHCNLATELRFKSYLIFSSSCHASCDLVFHCCLYLKIIAYTDCSNSTSSLIEAYTIHPSIHPSLSPGLARHLPFLHNHTSLHSQRRRSQISHFFVRMKTDPEAWPCLTCSLLNREVSCNPVLDATAC